MINISNIRFGFATNSSSTHSIIYKAGLHDNYNGQEFGWGEFTLASPDAKKLYLAQLLYHTINPQLGEELAYVVVHDIFNFPIDTEGYIDHQSFMQLPISNLTRNTSLEFFKDLVKHYLKDNIAIVGGNDNIDDDKELKYSKDIRHNHILPVDTNDNLICRKDKEWWIILNTRTGTKMRLSFNDNPKPYTKASSPELVDLKITDQCLNKCGYCYQNSTPNGKHADRNDISNIIWNLSNIGVFEIALGGGEPTLHPYFVNILEDLYYHHILANFTTRNLNWVHNDLMVNAIDKYVSRFGVSISSWDDIENTFKMIPDKLHHKIYFHYIIGTGFLKNILKEYPKDERTLILLGFKKIGRGATYKIYNPEDNWLKWVKDSMWDIGIDTKLANDYKDKLKDENQLLITYDEGKFSCYIDAVEMKMGNCSYADNYKSIKDFKPKDYLKLFASY